MTQQEIQNFLKEHPETKICRKCSKEKPLSEFCKKSKNKDGKHIYCKECQKIDGKEYRETHKEVVKLYRDSHKEKNKLYMKNYYNVNKKYMAEQQLNRYHTDMGFKMLVSCRNRVVKVLKRNSKEETTRELLGCSPNEFKQHLESKFKEGMNWSNYGMKGWVLDHIIPCSAFDLSKEGDRRKCFHYTNIQPLWDEENREKADKILILN